MAFPTGWARKHAITIDNTKVSGASALTDFRFNITLDHLDSEVVDAGANSALNGGGDLRFTTDSAGTTQIPCDIATFVTNATAGLRACDITVKVPSVSNSVDTTIYIWYGAAGETQPAVTDTYGRDAVWSAAIEHHDFYDLDDNTGNGADLTLYNGATVADGVFTGGSGKGADVPDIGQLENQTTLSFHARGNTGNLTIGSGSSPHRIFNADGGSCVAAGLNTAQFGIWNQGWTYITFAAGDDTDIDLWLTYDGSTYRLYNDGALVSTAAKAQVTGTNGTKVQIGNSTVSGTSTFWPGTLTELTFFNATVTSADLIATEYNNKSAPATFATAGTPSVGIPDVTAPILSSPTGTATGTTTATGTVITDELNGTLYYMAMTTSEKATFDALSASAQVAYLIANGSSQAVS